MLIPVTTMNDVKVLIGLHGIKMVEETAYAPEHADSKLKPAREGAPAPETTQPMEKASPTAARPIICSKITFHDGKTLVVREIVSQIDSISRERPIA